MFGIFRSWKNQTSLAIGLAACVSILSVSFMEAHAESSSPKGGQWSNAGGKIVASGKHEFKNRWWAAHRYADGGGKYWKTTKPMLIPDVKKATHTQEEVTQDVLIPKGQISVQGPGILAVFQKGSPSAGAVLKFPSGKAFHATGLGKLDLYVAKDGSKTWRENNVLEFDPNRAGAGKVPGGKTLNLSVWAYSNWNDWAIWGRGYSAPKEIEYEFWFFPQKGGKVIKVSDINTAASKGAKNGKKTASADLPETFGYDTSWTDGVRPAGGEAGDVNYNFKPKPITNPPVKPAPEPLWGWWGYQQDVKNIEDSIANNEAQLMNKQLSASKRKELNSLIAESGFALAEMKGEQVWLDHTSKTLMDGSNVILSYNPVVGPYLSAVTIATDISKGNWGNVVIGALGYLGKVSVGGKVIVNNAGQNIQLGADYYQKVLLAIVSKTGSVKSGRPGGAYSSVGPNNAVGLHR